MYYPEVIEAIELEEQIAAELAVIDRELLEFCEND